MYYFFGSLCPPRDHTPLIKTSSKIRNYLPPLTLYLPNSSYALHYVKLQQCMSPRRSALQAVGLIEHAGHFSDCGNIPSTEILVKAVGMRKHVVHRNDCRNIPAAEVLVEAAGTMEHHGHISDQRHPPMTDVPVGSLCLYWVR